MARTLRKPDPAIFKGWTFVLILAGVLTLLAMFARGNSNAVQVTPPPPGATCQFQATIDNLNVRTEPQLNGNAPVQTVNKGQVVAGTPTVTNGYRELTGGLWTLNQYLAPVSGSPCP